MATNDTSPDPLSSEQTNEVRRQVRQLLEASPSFRALPADKQREIAYHTVQVCQYLAAPGIPPDRLAAAQQAGTRDGRRPPLAGAAAAEGQFTAQAALQGAAAAGAYLQAVNFPDFVSRLIEGVFHSIVRSSIEQMEAYAKLVQSVAMTLNQFRDENVTANEGRDHLVDQFPDLFEISVDTGEDGAQPRVRMRDGVDEDTAVERVKSLPVEGQPITSLDDETIEGRLVPAARTQLATSRQQLLATMVLMGINRIIVTDGRIAAKVLFDFQARDNFKFAKSATKFDYAPGQYRYSSEGDYERNYQGASSSGDDKRDASYYTKGKYKYSADPVVTLASATQSTTDAQLTTKATLSGNVEVNFKSETFPLEKMADSFQIGQIQNSARPGAGRAAAAAPAAAPAGSATTPPPASTPAPAGGGTQAPAR